MKKGVLFIFFAAMILAARCQIISYNLATIPDSIKKDAGVIIQFENIVYRVDDLDNATFHLRRIFTVINEDGKDELDFSVQTSKYVSLDDAEIKVYDANGKQLSKHKKKEMSTHSIGEGLIEDGYIVYFNINESTFPITVDMEFELKIKGTVNYPSYHLLRPETGVIESSFMAIVPSGIDLRHKEINTSLKPEMKDDGKKKSYTWQVKNMKPVSSEQGTANSAYIYPSIKLAPNRFSYYGYKGDLSSWKNYGLWLQQLYTGLDQLPEYRKAFFNDLVKDAKNDKEKIKLIYDYLQKNFRYVSIQLGIGGMKPFSADFTDQKKYGDCKGLSNYMKAALNAVGIKSNIAIINSGYNSLPVDPLFPADEFDHVILCVPQKNDSIWLECTSSTIDFDFLSTFTENRYALLITDDGGVLVPTPRSNPDANKQSVFTTIKLMEDGSGETGTIFTSTGDYKKMMDEIVKEKKDEQKQHIVLGMSFKQPDNFELNKKNDNNGGYVTELKMTIEKVPEFSAGSKLFLAPRLYKIWSWKLPKAENRRLDFYFTFPFEKTDTTVYLLPASYKVDALPPVKEFKTEYASYISKCWYDETQKAVYSSVQIILKQHVIPAAKYAGIKKFFDDVLINDGQKIVIKKE